MRTAGFGHWEHSRDSHGGPFHHNVCSSSAARHASIQSGGILRTSVTCFITWDRMTAPQSSNLGMDKRFIEDTLVLTIMREVCIP